MSNVLETKYCRQCDTSKEVGDFGAHAKTQDKLQPYCRECTGKRLVAAKQEAKRKKVAMVTPLIPEIPQGTMIPAEPVMVGPITPAPHVTRKEALEWAIEQLMHAQDRIEFLEKQNKELYATNQHYQEQIIARDIELEEIKLSKDDVVSLDEAENLSLLGWAPGS